MPTEVWVVDASPIILLGKIGLAPLLTKISGRLIIPEAVMAEINRASPQDLGRQALEAIIQNDHPLVYKPAPHPVIDAFGLDPGESDVLTAILDRVDNSTTRIAVMDEIRGRRAATALGIPTLGTIGVLIRAKDDGEIAAIAPCLHNLRAIGAWLSDGLCMRAAHSVGESWP